jgi:hypothetical protein
LLPRVKNEERITGRGKEKMKQKEKKRQNKRNEGERGRREKGRKKGTEGPST